MAESKEKTAELLRKKQLAQARARREAESTKYKTILIALSGALANFARQGQAPVPPVNLVGDMGGGGLMLAFGVVCALLHARRCGQGQVVDAAIVDGSAALTAMLYGLVAQGRWSGPPGTNFADTGAPYYDVYEAAFYAAMGTVLRLTV